MRRRRRRVPVVTGTLVFLVGVFVLSALQSRMKIASLDRAGSREARKLEQSAKPAAPVQVSQPVVAVAAAPKGKAVDVAVPMVWEGTPAPAASHAQVVMPAAPRGLRRAAEIDLFIKVSADGRVSSVATGTEHNPALRRAAEEALMQWRFDPVESDRYRDARVRFRFARSGVKLVVPGA